jgi:dihydroorotase
MFGVQTLLPVMLNHVAEGRLSLERLVDLTSHGPQRVFGIAGKGRMAEGYDADLTIVDLKAERVLRHEDMASRCGWTPFDGLKVKGYPVMTVIRGRTVMSDGQIVLPAQGQPVRFQESLAL